MSAYKIRKSDKSFSNFSFLLYYTFLVSTDSSIFRTWSNLAMELFLRKDCNSFKLLTIFAKILHRRCSTELKINFWLRTGNTERTLVPSVQNKPKNILVRKYVWDRFWKGVRSWWDSKQNECLCRSSRPKSSLKKCDEKICRI